VIFSNQLRFGEERICVGLAPPFFLPLPTSFSFLEKRNWNRDWKRDWNLVRAVPGFHRLCSGENRDYYVLKVMNRLLDLLPCLFFRRSIDLHAPKPRKLLVLEKFLFLVGRRLERDFRLPASIAMRFIMFRDRYLHPSLLSYGDGDFWRISSSPISSTPTHQCLISCWAFRSAFTL